MTLFLPASKHVIKYDSRMERILFPNLCFEDELQGRTPSKSALDVAAQLTPLMGLLSLDRPDVPATMLVPDDAVPDDLPDCLAQVRYVAITDFEKHSCGRGGAEFLPWGWSASARKIAQQLGCVVSAPAVECVTEVNRREFQFPFDVTVDATGGLCVEPFSVLCQDELQVEAALRRFVARGNGDWVIKSSLSHAARNRLLGRGSELSAATLTWIRRRFEIGEAVAVEPWVSRIAECGLQFLIQPASPEHEFASAGHSGGGIEFIGAAELLTHCDGRYFGSVIHHDDSSGWWTPAIGHGLKVAAAAQAKGFHGHLGIDCMRYRDATTGLIHVRLAHDINGRLTMGRLALSLRALLEPEQTGFWLHHDRQFLNTQANRFDELRRRGVRIGNTSPGRVGGQEPRLLTTLLTGAADATELRQFHTELVASGQREEAGN